MKERKDSKTVKRLRITIVVTVTAFALTALCYVLMRYRMPGMHFAFYLILACSAMTILYMALWSLGAHERYGKAARILRRCYLVCLAAGVAVFLILEVLIITGGRTDDAPADCMIILGAGLYGETPLATLTARLDAAIEYLNLHEDIPVIVSGGQGPGETITEAEAMRRYLIRSGIDESRIWKEDASTSTSENFAYSRAMMKRIGLDPESVTVAIVTNEFHLYRAGYIAGKTGLDTVGIAARSPTVGLRSLYYCREAFALAYVFVFGV